MVARRLRGPLSSTKKNKPKEKLRKYIAQILPAISMLALFQNSLDLGKSLSALIKYYSQLRDFIFSPLSYLQIELPDKFENIITFTLTICIAFLLRGSKYNKGAVIGFLGSFIWLVIGLVIVFIGYNICGEEIFSKSDRVGINGLSIIEKIRYFLSIIIVLPGTFLTANFVIWVIAILTPFILHGLIRFPLTGIGLAMPFAMITEWTFSLFQKYFPEQVNILGDTADDREKLIYEYGKFWTLKKYIEYYKPLIDLAFAILFIVLIFKIIVDNL